MISSFLIPRNSFPNARAYSCYGVKTSLNFRNLAAGQRRSCASTENRLSASDQSLRVRAGRTPLSFSLNHSGLSADESFFAQNQEVHLTLKMFRQTLSA